jgi:c-di-GMP-binding flagellar brake protein YcgR
VADDDLTALVGRWARLRLLVEPTPAPPTDRPLRVVAPPAPAVEVALVACLERVLRAETRDRRALGLAGQAVMVELGAAEAMLRVPATARVLVDRPLPVVLALTATGGIEHLQRRQWVRARVQVPAEVVTEAVRRQRGEAGDVEGFRATTVDLSSGGARLRTAEPLAFGERLDLTLWLPSGPIEVAAVVLDAAGDGTARVQFEPMAEAVGKRLTRFVFDVQVRSHRSG